MKASEEARSRPTGGDVATAVRSQAKRYLPFYLFGLAFALVMVLLPTPPQERATTLDGFGTSAAGEQGFGREGPGGSEGPAETGSTSGSTPSGSGGSGATPEASTEGTGTDGSSAGGSEASLTRGGVECTPGVRQIPESAYAAPCRATWTGDDAGNTARGVTSETIKIVSRDYEDSPSGQAIYAVQERAGAPPREEVRRMRNVFVEHFNEVFELYGRRVVVEDYRSSADVVAEIQNKGREQACADATEIADEMEAFAVLPPAGGLSYGPFSECAAERELLVPIGPYGFPESWYQRYHPYAWGIQMDCQRIAHLVGEYAIKRLFEKQARWARDPLYQDQTRAFGGIGPDIDAYAECIDILVDEVERSGEDMERYNYTVDPATMPQQASQAVVQFKAAGVTTIVLGSDFLMNINLTQQARSQSWGPEWVIIGAGFQDFDNYTRLYDQDRVDGHLFGLSQLGATEHMVGPESEPVRMFRKIAGEDPPENTTGDYFTLIHLFNMLQEAGPDLRPGAIPAAVLSLPPSGAPDYAMGLWNFRVGPDGTPGVGEHTAVDDSREVYWDGSATSPDGSQGTYVVTYDGRRFTNGEWPSEDPPVYPDR